jgi:hypothetical protein
MSDGIPGSFRDACQVVLERRISAREGEYLEVAGQPALAHVDAPPHAVGVIPPAGETPVLRVLPGRPCPGFKLEAHPMDASTGSVLAQQVTRLGRRQRRRLRHRSADGGELAGGSEHMRSDLVDVAFAQQPRGREVPRAGFRPWNQACTTSLLSRSANSLAA